MALRDKWEFDFSANELASAAYQKATHHSDRLKFWQITKDQVIADIRKEGLNVEESLSDQFSNTSYGHGPQVTVKTEFQRKLNECTTKIQEHDAKQKEYAGWVQTLNANPNSRVKLHNDDYLYFFAK